MTNKTSQTEINRVHAGAKTFNVFMDNDFSRDGYRHITVRLFGEYHDNMADITFQADREHWDSLNIKWYAGKVHLESSSPDSFALMASLLKKFPDGWTGQPGEVVKHLRKAGWTQLVNVKKGYASDWFGFDAIKELQGRQHMGLFSLDIRRDGNYCIVRKFATCHKSSNGSDSTLRWAEDRLMATIGEELGSREVREAIAAGRYTVEEWPLDGIDTELKDLFVVPERVAAAV